MLLGRRGGPDARRSGDLAAPADKEATLLVAACSWELSLPGCASLKGKRRVVKSLKDRLRSRFNVSVAETAHQDVWTRAQLSIALVTSDGRLADSIRSKDDRAIEAETRAVILSSKRDLF